MVRRGRFHYALKYPNLSKKGWQRATALNMLSTKSGNCYSFACGFAALTKEIGEYSNENRNEIKGKNIELRQKDYDKSIMLDDEQVVLREAKKILNDKIEVFHISSALI